MPTPAYKLFRLRRDGSIGSLFIHRTPAIPLGRWLTARSYPTKGFAVRPGWHCCFAPLAPHLSKKGRIWARVEIDDFEVHARPASQGGLWYTAKRMRVLELLP